MPPPQKNTKHVKLTICDTNSDFTHVHKLVNRNYRKQLSHKSPDTRTQRLSVIHGISNSVVNGIWLSQIQLSIICLCAPSLSPYLAQRYLAQSQVLSVCACLRLIAQQFLGKSQSCAPFTSHDFVN